MSLNFEIMSKLSLGQLHAPCIYYNLDGYYDDVKHFLQQMIAKGFSSAEKQQGVYFAESLEEIKGLLGFDKKWDYIAAFFRVRNFLHLQSK